MAGSGTSTTVAATDAKARLLLQQAADLLARKQFPQAETLLTGLLSHRPQDPDALHMMGVIHAAQERGAEAEEFYRRSLIANPSQAQVRYNFGTLLRANGRLPEAVEEFRAASRLKRNYVEACFALALTLHEAGEPEASEKAYRDTLRLQPNFLPAKQGLGAVLNDLGRPEDAERVLRQALAANSRDPRLVAALENNLGVSVNLQRRFKEALTLFDSAREKVPGLPFVHVNRGDALQHLGRLDDAVRAYRQAIAANPLDLTAHTELNNLLYRQSDDRAFLKSYDQALETHPNATGLLTAKAGFLFNAEDFGGARIFFERATVASPNDPGIRDSLGLTLARLGEFDAAIHAHETAIALDAKRAQLWLNFSETLLRAGDAQKSLTLAERALSLDPSHQGALAMASTALRVLDDPREVELNDFEGLVQTFELSPPDGYGDLESFNQDLDAYLDRLHFDKREMVTQTLRGGTQTLDNVFGRGHALIERLREKIDSAVVSYIANMAERDNHPFLSRRSGDFSYSGSWSSRLRDCGYHTNHFHSKGWISSVYYVALPDSDSDPAAKQGWIKFGEPAFETTLKQPVRRSIQPLVGRLILFPSYFWHGTIPFRSLKNRTTIAFDIVPR